jgi:hypothetical protein
VKSVYKLKNSVTDKYIYNADGSIKTQEFTGTGNCTFKATNANFQIKLVSSDDFPGHSELIFGLGEAGEIQAWSIDGQTQYTVVSSNAIPTAIVFAGGTSFRVFGTSGDATITVNVKDGETDLGGEKITVSVIEPSGTYLIDDPDTTGYDHVKDTYGLSLKGRYVLTPFNVSFSNLKTKEWGDKKNAAGNPGYAEYTGVADVNQNYFAAIGWIGYLHEPGNYYSVMSCKDTYNKTKNCQGGPIINVKESTDTTGIPSGVGLPANEPKTGQVTVILPSRYLVQRSGDEGTINGATSIMTVQENEKKYKIKIQKTAITPLSVNSDAPTKTWTDVVPPIL